MKKRTTAAKVAALVAMPTVEMRSVCRILQVPEETLLSRIGKTAF